MVVEIDFWLVMKVPASQCIKLKHEEKNFSSMASGFKTQQNKKSRGFYCCWSLKALCWKPSSYRVKIEAGVKVCYAHGFQTNCV